MLVNDGTLSSAYPNPEAKTDQTVDQSISVTLGSQSAHVALEHSSPEPKDQTDHQSNTATSNSDDAKFASEANSKPVKKKKQKREQKFNFLSAEGAVDMNSAEEGNTTDEEPQKGHHRRSSSLMQLLADAIVEEDAKKKARKKAKDRLKQEQKDSVLEGDETSSPDSDSETGSDGTSSYQTTSNGEQNDPDIEGTFIETPRADRPSFENEDTIEYTLPSGQMVRGVKVNQEEVEAEMQILEAPIKLQKEQKEETKKLQQKQEEEIRKIQQQEAREIIELQELEPDAVADVQLLYVTVAEEWKHKYADEEKKLKRRQTKESKRLKQRLKEVESELRKNHATVYKKLQQLEGEENKLQEQSAEVRRSLLPLQAEVRGRFLQQQTADEETKRQKAIVEEKSRQEFIDKKLDSLHQQAELVVEKVRKSRPFSFYLKELWHQDFPEGFWGVPTKDSDLADYIEYIGGGFILVPLKNLVKLCTQGVFHFFEACFHYLSDKAESKVDRFFADIGWGFFKGLRVIARAVISPLDSLNAALQCKGWKRALAVTGSLLLTGIGWAAIGWIAAPYLLVQKAVWFGVKVAKWMLTAATPILGAVATVARKVFHSIGNAFSRCWHWMTDESQQINIAQEANRRRRQVVLRGVPQNTNVMREQEQRPVQAHQLFVSRSSDHARNLSIVSPQFQEETIGEAQRTKSPSPVLVAIPDPSPTPRVSAVGVSVFNFSGIDNISSTTGFPTQYVGSLSARSMVGRSHHDRTVSEIGPLSERGRKTHGRMASDVLHQSTILQTIHDERQSSYPSVIHRDGMTESASYTVAEDVAAGSPPLDAHLSGLLTDVSLDDPSPAVTFSDQKVAPLSTRSTVTKSDHHMRVRSVDETGSLSERSCQTHMRSISATSILTPSRVTFTTALSPVADAVQLSHPTDGQVITSTMMPAMPSQVPQEDLPPLMLDNMTMDDMKRAAEQEAQNRPEADERQRELQEDRYRADREQEGLKRAESSVVKTRTDEDNDYKENYSADDSEDEDHEKDGKSDHEAEPSISLMSTTEMDVSQSRINEQKEDTSEDIDSADEADDETSQHSTRVSSQVSSPSHPNLKLDLSKIPNHVSLTNCIRHTLHGPPVPVAQSATEHTIKLPIVISDDQLMVPSVS